MNGQLWSADIFVHYGCMFSGKTHLALTIAYAVKRANEEGHQLNLVVLKPNTDTRGSCPAHLETHTGIVLDDINTVVVEASQPESILTIPEVREAGVVLADEYQFYTESDGRAIAMVADQLRRMGKRVHLLGLDTDHRGNRFPAHRAICELDGVIKEQMFARCHRCGFPATHSRRIIKYPDRPPIQAPWDDDLIAVDEQARSSGGVNAYWSVCYPDFKECWREAGINLDR